MFLRNALAAVGIAASLSPAVLAKPLPRQEAGRLVVYWGAEDDATTLDVVCGGTSYDIVNLAFLDTFYADGGWPSLTMSGLDSPSQAQSEAGATGLKDGSSLVDAINTCQSSGKLVFLSLGGYDADVTLSGDEQGEEIADTLWDLFGGGTESADLRPFGDVKVDGFDLDNESHNSQGYLAMAKRLRSNFESDTSKTYYLSAAPQCPFPDDSQPQDVCQQMDYVWVQFYNNGDCNVGQSGFEQAVQTWSDGIGDATLFIGGLASDADGDEGYVEADALVDAINSVKSMNLPNYGGAMLWEAQLATQNGNFQDQIKPAV